jgi:hypothetical protein
MEHLFPARLRRGPGEYPMLIDQHGILPEVQPCPHRCPAGPPGGKTDLFDVCNYRDTNNIDRHKGGLAKRRVVRNRPAAFPTVLGCGYKIRLGSGTHRRRNGLPRHLPPTRLQTKRPTLIARLRRRETGSNQPQCPPPKGISIEPPSQSFASLLLPSTIVRQWNP